MLDYNYGEWQVNKETGQKERLVTYKTIAQSVMGSNTLTCREKQVNLFFSNILFWFFRF